MSWYWPSKKIEPEGPSPEALQVIELEAQVQGLEVRANKAELTEATALRKVDEAEARMKFAIDMHPMVRVGFVDIDPVKLTAQARGIVSDLKVEVAAGRLWVFAEHQLTEPEMNALDAKLPFKLDRT